MDGNVSWGWIVPALVAEGLCVVIAFAARGLRSRRNHVSAGPETFELGDEPPAVVNAVTHHFDATREAAAATVLDLAARGFVGIEYRNLDLSVVRLGDAGDRATLLPYERMVLDALERHADHGEVPTQAAALAVEDPSHAWWARFEAEIEADLIHRELLAAPQMPVPLFWLFGPFALLVLAALCIGVAAGYDVEVALGGPLITAASLSVVAVGIGYVWILLPLPPPATPAGLACARRWLGVGRMIATGAFEDVLPAGSALWDRYLAYATALDLAPQVVRALPFGSSDPRHEWSPATGVWRPVRIQYPLWRPGWGRRPSRVLLVCLGGAVVGALLWLQFDSSALPAARIAEVGAATLVVVALAGAVAAATDLFTTRRVTGRLLRLHHRDPDEDLGSWRPLMHRARWFAVVDDGAHDRLRALSISRSEYRALREGTDVRVSYTPLLGYLLRVAAVSEGDEDLDGEGQEDRHTAGEGQEDERLGLHGVEPTMRPMEGDR